MSVQPTSCWSLRPETSFVSTKTEHLKLSTAATSRPCVAYDPVGGPGHPRSSDQSLDHASVCTSTENTDGRCETIGAQLSPESGDMYTWPPVVPK